MHARLPSRGDGYAPAASTREFIIIRFSTGGILGFLLLIAALPTLPMFGVPAVTGATVYLLGVVTSLGAWLAIGHLAALRASKRAVVDWSDWRREFIPLALGLLLGGVLALIIGGLVLGAL